MTLYTNYHQLHPRGDKFLSLADGEVVPTKSRKFPSLSSDPYANPTKLLISGYTKSQTHSHVDIFRVKHITVILKYLQYLAPVLQVFVGMDHFQSLS